MRRRCGAARACGWRRTAPPPSSCGCSRVCWGCWVDSFEVFEKEERAEALLDYATLAASNGYRWLAAECFAVLVRIDRLHARGWEAWREVPELEAELRAGLGPETLVSLIEPAEDWEYPLREIEKVARGVRKKRGKAGKRSSPRTASGLGSRVGSLRRNDLPAPPAGGRQERQMEQGPGGGAEASRRAGGRHGFPHGPGPRGGGRDSPLPRSVARGTGVLPGHGRGLRLGGTPQPVQRGGRGSTSSVATRSFSSRRRTDGCACGSTRTESATAAIIVSRGRATRATR